MTARNRISLTLAAALALSAGCGGRDLPELAPGTGQVKLDGQPLPGVRVSFFPAGEGGGRPATGITDDDGNYELGYIEGEEGAKVGPNKVEVTTEWPEGEPPPGEKDKIPTNYNTTSTL